VKKAALIFNPRAGNWRTTQRVEAIRSALHDAGYEAAPLPTSAPRHAIELARELGALDALAYTHTCYQGRQPPCGECPACRLRANGFREAGIPDPLLARFSKE